MIQDTFDPYLETIPLAIRHIAMPWVCCLASWARSSTLGSRRKTLHRPSTWLTCPWRIA